MQTCNYKYILAMEVLSYQEMHDFTEGAPCVHLDILPIVIRKFSLKKQPESTRIQAVS